MKRLFYVLAVSGFVLLGVGNSAVPIQASGYFNECIVIPSDVNLNSLFRDDNAEMMRTLPTQKISLAKLNDFFTRYRPGPNYRTTYQRFNTTGGCSTYLGCHDGSSGWEIVNYEPLVTAINEFQLVNNIQNEGPSYSQGWPYIGAKTREAIKDISCYRKGKSSAFKLELDAPAESLHGGVSNPFSWRTQGFTSSSGDVVEVRQNTVISPTDTDPFQHPMIVSSQLIASGPTRDRSARGIIPIDLPNYPTPPAYYYGQNYTFDYSGFTRSFYDTNNGISNRPFVAYLKLASVNNLAVFRTGEVTLPVRGSGPEIIIRYPNQAINWIAGSRVQVEYGHNNALLPADYLTFSLCLTRENYGGCVKTLPITGVGSVAGIGGVGTKESITVPADVAPGAYYLRLEGRRSGIQVNSAAWINRYSEAYSTGVINVLPANTIVQPPPVNPISPPSDITLPGTVCTDLLTNLQNGSQDTPTRTDVRKLQTFLTATRDFHFAGVLGYYGRITENAVKAFQGRYVLLSGTGHDTAGVVGPLTRAKIKDLTCPKPDRPVDDHSVINPPPVNPTTRRLNVIVAGTAANLGIVQSSPVGISCGTDCIENYNSQTGTVTLTHNIPVGVTFVGWSGCASMTGNNCNILMDGNKTVTATFNTISTVTRTISGTLGAIGATVAITGGGSCSVTGSSYTYTCVGIPNGASVVITPSKTGGAFTPPARTYSSVVSSVSNLNFTFTANTVTPPPLTTRPTQILIRQSNNSSVGGATVRVTDAGATVFSTATASSGLTPTYNLELNKNYGIQVSANGFQSNSGNFSVPSGATLHTYSLVLTPTSTTNPPANPTTYLLSVSKNGTGLGTVTGGVSCGTSCSHSYNSGSPVTLTATPFTGSTFVGWSGCNSVSGSSCIVTMNSAKLVTATFNTTTTPPPNNPTTYLLSVSKNGTGLGTVTGGVSCGTSCSHSYNSGSPVTLTATPFTGSTFAGWSGCNSTSGTTCTVMMDGVKSVTSTFNTVSAPPPAPTPTGTLTVSKAGAGFGTVTSSLSGIDCGSTCAYNFNLNSTITLTATPASGSSFGNWPSGCTSTNGNVCTVTMNATKTVAVTFVSNTASTQPIGVRAVIKSNATNVAISGASVSVLINGTTYNLGLTDASGYSPLSPSVAMPSQPVTFTVSKSGYSTQTFTVSVPANPSGSIWATTLKI